MTLWHVNIAAERLQHSVNI